MVELTSSDQEVRVSLKGRVLIDTAQEFGSALKSAFSENKTIIINLKEVSALDITALQLIWSAVVTARRDKLQLRFAIRSYPSLLQILDQSGFSRFFLPKANK